MHFPKGARGVVRGFFRGRNNGVRPFDRYSRLVIGQRRIGIGRETNGGGKGQLLATGAAIRQRRRQGSGTAASVTGTPLRNLARMLGQATRRRG